MVEMTALRSANGRLDSSSIDDSVKTLSLADSHRLWQAHLHKKFAGAARGGADQPHRRDGPRLPGRRGGG
jgi:hypothetical protein